MEGYVGRETQRVQYTTLPNPLQIEWIEHKALLLGISQSTWETQQLFCSSNQVITIVMSLQSHLCVPTNM